MKLSKQKSKEKKTLMGFEPAQSGQRRFSSGGDSNY